jgi:hypothetical protein
MSTNDLIEALVGDLRPLARGLLFRRIAGGALAGIALSAGMMLALLGGRPDFLRALLSEPYWLKAGYTLLLATCGFLAAFRLSRPDGQALVPALLAGLSVAVIGGLAMLQAVAAPTAVRMQLVFGNSALVCPWLIALLAAPILAGLFWAMRGLAPTQLRAAGLAAGLAAGAAAAWVYAFHCPEEGIPFVALWYTGGMAVSGAVGLLLGPRLLRW